ncbi:biotin-dependent carboxyltransferase family protein [Pontibacterium granulatum]|uniref:5-oxoprolinase subunit C family protein n=1 Tax=Pontibacterium granulatum TaxID=2036029 RepID=UPI00249C152A|nr:biotin-dependent carboxyltransferase family protein [Pontibacterium granulatum]MDI3324418.1 biotin-dependent carboxyltransferase family protein [Pontibacterium granulatum]
MQQGLTVITPGPLTLIQDLGRFGLQHQGLTSGGAMDEVAARWANRLLGNDANAPLLEITLGHLEVVANVASWIAITGAECDLRINGAAKCNWSVHSVMPSDRIKLGWSRSGVRVYLAVVGGFRVVPELGSVATVVREQMGGLDGKPIEAGMLLPCDDSRITFNGVPAVPFRYRPDYDETPLRLRLIPGYQFSAVEDGAVAALLSEPYKILPQSDRMGYRLQGAPVISGLNAIHSEGVTYGVVQVPPDGQPIVLMKDRQTIGGYPKLGSILPLDLYQLSQRRAGQMVLFELISLQEAQQLMVKYAQFFD